MPPRQLDTLPKSPLPCSCGAPPPVLGLLGTKGWDSVLFL